MADLELDELMSGFDPDNDEVDRMLLFLITGRNKDGVTKDWIGDDGAGRLEPSPDDSGTFGNRPETSKVIPSIQNDDEPLLP